ncbi:MAG TPA: FAD-dependent oxidoreductase [Ktedonobacteraceae bacterium]|nr:FAD-dependent oxidoreductase [Ktedonobacteraceae bacterium]
MYDGLFQPLSIGPREASNRIIFGSHTTNLAHHHRLSSQHGDYYATRAAGGAGIIVLEEHIVHPSDLPYESAVLGYLPETAQAIATVTAQIHAHGTLALVQLNHNGQQSTSDYHQRELWAPSPVPNVSSREVPKAMELDDMHAVIDGFAQVARYAAQGKADGVELQIADSSLLRQFLSLLTNQRTDQYGGTLENRLRFVQETIEAVDAVLGTDRILGLRFCADELAPWAGLTPEQSTEIARMLTGTGRIDYMTITMGSIFSTQMFPFHASMHVAPGYAAHLAAAIRAAVNVPVFAAGRIMNAAQAERILKEEQADGVELIRTLIADPDLPRLSRENQADSVRPCIACNQGCQVRSIVNATISCTVNPDVTNAHPLSRSIKIEPATNGQTPSVWIIGAGPAGLEAARTAALRGRSVAIYEREEMPGGTAALAAKGPGRSELQLITDYLQAELKRLEVPIYTGVEVSAEMVLEGHPTTVIVATGAQPGPGLLPVPGYDLPHVTNIREVLRGKPLDGQHVLVIDESGSHGVLSAVELLAAQGKRVEVVSEDWYIGHDLASTHDIVQWMQRILALGVLLTPHTTVTRIEPGQVILTDRFAEGEQVRPVDIVVLGTYEQPSQDLYFALKGRVPRLFRIGDCVAPRRIEQAILEGRQVGAQI